MKHYWIVKWVDKDDCNVPVQKLAYAETVRGACFEAFGQAAHGMKVKDLGTRKPTVKQLIAYETEWQLV